MKKTPFSLKLVAAMLLLSVASCSKDDDVDTTGGLSSLTPFTFYALAGGTQLDAFSTQDPSKSTGTATITGLQSGETILSIDFRPATGQLYGVGSSSRLYVINPTTGAARMIGAGPFTPALSGSVAGFDFNPTVDRIRLVTNTGQNLRLNPETGAVAATDGAINGATGASITAVAYTSNLASATATTLYDIDVTSQKLYKQMPPNDGTLVEVGPLNLKVTGNGGFDIAPTNDTALGLFTVDGKATLFTVDLTTGAARMAAQYTQNQAYTGIAIPTQPVAYAVTPTNSLLIFNPEAPATTATKTLTGLQTGETVVGIDFRPANGQLYAVGSTSRLYTINTSSGAATAVATLSTPLVGTSFGVDFNPTVDRIRIVSNTGQNLRVNPADGAATVDGALNPGTPGVTGAAYTNNFAGATTTTLFDIDATTDKLLTQTPPNNGTLVEVGNLGVNVEAANGFDIGGTSGTAYALLTVGTTTSLYRINTTTGAATSIGSFGSSTTGFALGLGF